MHCECTSFVDNTKNKRYTKTETLAAEAALLAVEDSVVNSHSQRIHFDSWDHVFADGGPLFDVLVDYEAFEPFTGADLPTR